MVKNSINLARRYGSKLATAATLAMITVGPAFAAGDYDTTDATTSISEGKIAVVAICSALLVIAIVKKVWGKLGGR